MANEHTDFWLALLNLHNDVEHRTQVWNGYLGWKLLPQLKEEIAPRDVWPKLMVDPPDGGWPELTKKDQETIENLANAHGGHPELKYVYMNFSDIQFSAIDLSGLTFIYGNFRGANFGGERSLFDKARFFGKTFFNNAVFEDVQFFNAIFYAPVYFNSSQFKGGASFDNVNFMGGASFYNALFGSYAYFNGSKFEERYFSGPITAPVLTNFRNAKFMDAASFRDVLFGNDEIAYSREAWSERRVDFSDTEFKATTNFCGAVFGGAPAFFNATLHEDTDFSRIDWKKAETENISADYAIRAWERLELIMSKLEKPLERHQFFRLKMRARRRIDSWFLRVLNRLFEVTADYGWSVWRAFMFWFLHWFGSSIVLYMNAGSVVAKADYWKLAKAALGTGFANAHAFLGLASGEGYLAGCREVLEENNTFGFLTAIGTIEAFFGPVFLFLLLLTLRNRFRLA